MLTIAWDVDDVLNNFTEEWFERRWRLNRPDCRLTYGDLLKNPPCELLGISMAEYRQSLDAFRLSHMADLRPVHEAVEWFERSGHRFRHAAVTAVPVACAAVSASWVLTHFGRWIRSFHFIPSEREGHAAPIYDQTKAAFLQRYKRFDLFVEDSLENAEGARLAGIRTIVMPRPWNFRPGGAADVFSELEAF